MIPLHPAAVKPSTESLATDLAAQEMGLQVFENERFPQRAMVPWTKRIPAARGTHKAGGETLTGERARDRIGCSLSVRRACWRYCGRR
jgi:hypothetical protein